MMAEASEDPTEATTTTVLLIGARGFLGTKVWKELVKWQAEDETKKKRAIVALIRIGSDASSLGVDEHKVTEGMYIVRGDLMDKNSLERAVQNVDVVINTANGYMAGYPEVDVEGGNNLLEVLHQPRCSVTKYLYCSVLTCDTAPYVEHFRHKHLHEQKMKLQADDSSNNCNTSIQYIALRAGAFLDQSDDYLADGILQDRTLIPCVWNKNVPLGMIYSVDLALYFVQAIDSIPQQQQQQHRFMCIDVGWSRSISYDHIVKFVGFKLNKNSFKCYSVLPWWVRNFAIATVGQFRPLAKEMLRMFEYMDSGMYILPEGGSELQEEYFGPPAAPEDAISRYLAAVLLNKKEDETTTSSEDARKKKE